MFNRRSFFSKVAAVVAAVALAPEIAFRAALPLPLVWKKNTVGIYEQLRMCEQMPNTGPLDLPALFKQLYAIKSAREARGYEMEFYLTP